MRTRVKMLRWPRVLRNPLRRFFLKTRSFGPRASPSTTPRTFALATNGAPARISPASFSTSSTWSKVNSDPVSPGVPSTSTTAPGVTLSWRPRVWMMAYTGVSSAERAREPGNGPTQRIYRNPTSPLNGSPAATSRQARPDRALLEKDAGPFDLLAAEGAQEARDEPVHELEIRRQRR